MLNRIILLTLLKLYPIFVDRFVATPLKLVQAHPRRSRAPEGLRARQHHKQENNNFHETISLERRRDENFSHIVLHVSHRKFLSFDFKQKQLKAQRSRGSVHRQAQALQTERIRQINASMS